MDNRNMYVPTKFLVVLLAATIFSCQPKQKSIEDYSPDLILLWNKKITDLAIEQDGLLTLNGVRTQAMANIAVHNALNAINPVYETYEYSGSHPEADPISAAAQSLYEVVKNSFPDSESRLQLVLDSTLMEIPEGEAKKLGIQLGKETSMKILEIRNNDEWNSEAEYTWHPMAPGVYSEFREHSGTPEGFIFGAGWAKAHPFMLQGPDHFRSPPPPPIDSDEYTKAYEEVKIYGSTNSEKRTADQAHLAMWWKDFVENSHNRLARELIQKEGLNMWEASRTFALLNMTIYDAYVSVFDNKFHYNHWRPYTAIRWAENDGNPGTEADPEWDNLHRHTYAFPSYPSAHGTASSAAMRVLSNTLGTGDEYPFTMTTHEVDSAGPFSGKMKMDPPVRSFNTFSEAGLQASMSRVYLGIHFRYDSEEGHRLGNRIGDYANSNFLLKLED